MRQRILLVFVSCLMAVVSEMPVSFAKGTLPVPTLSDETTLAASSNSILPLALAIRSHKPSFSVGERIVFELILTNISSSALKVYNLDNKAVFCDINGISWGTKNASGDMSVILAPGEFIRKSFKVSGVNVPKKFNINCSYGMGINKALPEASLTLDIVQ